MKRIIVLHQAVAPSAREDEKDILVQAACIREALEARGHEVITIPLTLDMETARRHIAAREPDAVFNLVESIDGRDEFISFAPLLLESMEIPFTGCASQAIAMTSHKVIAKCLMRQAGIPTPDWARGEEMAAGNATLSAPYIIKHCTNHASLGITDESVVMQGDGRHRFHMRDPWNYFAEGFIQGREFNISLIAGAHGVAVLPAAEIKFENFSKDKPRIVNYAAKWDSAAPEFSGTPRTFDFPDSDKTLLEKLEEISRDCWKAFSLSGYARVDFRVDESGNPWVLEVNANPCLSPDAGFFAACERAGMDALSMAQGIVDDALHRNKGVI